MHKFSLDTNVCLQRSLAILFSNFLNRIWLSGKVTYILNHFYTSRIGIRNSGYHISKFTRYYILCISLIEKLSSWKSGCKLLHFKCTAWIKYIMRLMTGFNWKLSSTSVTFRWTMQHISPTLRVLERIKGDRVVTGKLFSLDMQIS